MKTVVFVFREPLTSVPTSDSKVPFSLSRRGMFRLLYSLIFYSTRGVSEKVGTKFSGSLGDKLVPLRVEFVFTPSLTKWVRPLLFPRTSLLQISDVKPPSFLSIKVSILEIMS